MTSGEPGQRGEPSHRSRDINKHETKGGKKKTYRACRTISAERLNGEKEKADGGEKRGSRRKKKLTQTVNVYIVRKPRSRSKKKETAGRGTKVGLGLFNAVNTRKRNLQKTPRKFIWRTSRREGNSPLTGLQ